MMSCLEDLRQCLAGALRLAARPFDSGPIAADGPGVLLWALVDAIRAVELDGELGILGG